jgi:hypothetical protein
MRSSKNFWWLAAVLAGALAVAPAPAVAQPDDDDEEPQTRKLQTIQGTVMQTERAAPTLPPDEGGRVAEERGTLPIPIPEPAGDEAEARTAEPTASSLEQHGTLPVPVPEPAGGEAEARTAEPTASSLEQHGSLPLPLPEPAGDEAERAQGTRVGH